MVVRDALKRHMPGASSARPSTSTARRAYVLTLATREQHIRRGKATSNICTNEALIALAANMYLSLMGKAGLREVAQQCLQKAAYLRKRLTRSPRCRCRSAARSTTSSSSARRIRRREILCDLEHEKILGGIPLARFFDGYDNDFLVAVTELHTREQLDHFVAALSAAMARERR